MVLYNNILPVNTWKILYEHDTHDFAKVPEKKCMFSKVKWKLVLNYLQFKFYCYLQLLSSSFEISYKTRNPWFSYLCKCPYILCRDLFKLSCMRTPHFFIPLITSRSSINTAFASLCHQLSRFLNLRRGSRDMEKKILCLFRIRNRLTTLWFSDHIISCNQVPTPNVR